MSEAPAFTYPFCYVPTKEIADAAQVMIHRIALSPALDSAFSEGKMLGVMKVLDNKNSYSYIYAFSGNVGGKNMIEGFVPPIYDLVNPQGHYKLREAVISALGDQMEATDDPKEKAALKARRKDMSVELQGWIFDQYRVSNALGETKTIREVFADRGIVPPGGTGDCAAPKLLQYAYDHGLKPVAMGEFWYGRSPAREVRHHGCFYPACTGKCGPLLDFMMQGLDIEPNPLEKEAETAVRIVFEDDAIIVADKPSDMLSVPGRTVRTSLQEILEKRQGIPIYACHRLDMDTSGLIVYAKTPQAHANLQQQFETHRVEKSYTALLKAGAELYDGPMEGVIDLPLITDWDDRPRQMVDFEHGKRAVTEYHIISVHDNGEIEVRFVPHTGRTHQLRVHAAHPLGLGHPIKGDRLYGGQTSSAQTQDPLHLRAAFLSFDHPVTGERMSFSLD